MHARLNETFAVVQQERQTIADCRRDDHKGGNAAKKKKDASSSSLFDPVDHVCAEALSCGANLVKVLGP